MIDLEVVCENLLQGRKCIIRDAMECLPLKESEKLFDLRIDWKSNKISLYQREDYFVSGIDLRYQTHRNQKLEHRD